METWALGVLMAMVLAIYVLAEQVQGRTPTMSLPWAVLDVTAHGSLAIFICLWVVPRWGWRIVAAAAAAATLIDLDHALVARSLVPTDMMSIGTRPWLHSFLGVALGTLLAAWAGGARLAYAVGVGMLTHVVRDASAPPGAPLLIPFDVEPSIEVPGWLLPSLVALLCGLGVWLTARRSPRAGTRCQRG
jgi:membrane-bound metal-dependent hydrolase YbcI (DUF457 family)